MSMCRRPVLKRVGTRVSYPVHAATDIGVKMGEGWLVIQRVVYVVIGQD
ncbi:MAG: hypothetical protein WCJ35_27490 [Planctomycetota bacterium]